MRAIGAAPEVRGVVIAAYGVGTVPSGRSELSDAIRCLSSSDTEVLVVTQHGGRVDLEAYKNSTLFCESGAIEGGSMRIEAAVPKLMHALAVYEDRAERAAYLTRDVAGEHA